MPDSTTKLPKQSRIDDLVEHRGCQQDAEHNKRQWVEHFLPGVSSPKQQRQQSDEVCRRRHHHGGQPLQTAERNRANRFVERIGEPSACPGPVVLRAVQSCGESVPSALTASERDDFSDVSRYVLTFD